VVSPRFFKELEIIQQEIRCDIVRDLWNLVYRMFGAKTGGGALGALEKEGLVKRILMLFGM
jgi:hypothetical protein